jgi:hypothetical protein
MSAKHRRVVKTQETKSTETPPLPIEAYVGFAEMQAERFVRNGGNLEELNDQIFAAHHRGGAAALGIPLRPLAKSAPSPLESSRQVSRSKAEVPPKAVAAGFHNKRRSA